MRAHKSRTHRKAHKRRHNMLTEGLAGELIGGLK